MSQKAQKIRVIIAEKPYGVTVTGEDEEQRVRAAAKRLEQKISKLKRRYNEDILTYVAMAALEIAVEREELEQKLDFSTDRLHVNELNKAIEDFLKEK